jgi:hypothetical protein
MGSRKFHEIWIEQCKAAEKIKLRYGFAKLVADRKLSATAPPTEPSRNTPRERRQ